MSGGGQELLATRQAMLEQAMKRLAELRSSYKDMEKIRGCAATTFEVAEEALGVIALEMESAERLERNLYLELQAARSAQVAP